MCPIANMLTSCRLTTVCLFLLCKLLCKCGAYRFSLKLIQIRELTCFQNVGQIKTSFYHKYVAEKLKANANLMLTNVTIAAKSTDFIEKHQFNPIYIQMWTVLNVSPFVFLNLLYFIVLSTLIFYKVFIFIVLFYSLF